MEQYVEQDNLSIKGHLLAVLFLIIRSVLVNEAGEWSYMRRLQPLYLIKEVIHI